ncbi:hypothetical protein [Alteromonas oceanisediminis]|uniref:hypothetical protein n=1 Tax=Alteromonas oceanisediminis TaxID=2836180 RepID=UPI001BD936DF|nr:hypothetical protein [Alteromonas oceanisediminis]MBT0587349.1 hypothetical protein [Alteromonas oceanisediminis]
MRISRTHLLSLSFVLLSAGATAQSFEQATVAVCDKMKTCALKQMGQEEDLTPQMRQMIEGMIAGMCDNVMDFSQIETHAELHKPAAACLQSMAALSCEELEEDVSTTECEAYEDVAEDY